MEITRLRWGSGTQRASSWLTCWTVSFPMLLQMAASTMHPTVKHTHTHTPASTVPVSWSVQRRDLTANTVIPRSWDVPVGNRSAKQHLIRHWQQHSSSSYREFFTSCDPV